MSITTKIQWCDSTCNPTMGCEGCELWTPKVKRCYAGILHLRFGGVTKGYSPTFEELTYWPGRMAKAARWRDLSGTRREDKPWLDGMPRHIFVSDMSDSLSAGVSFEFLEEEIIHTVSSEPGRRHRWLWLTKRPDRMARFSDWLSERGVEWPENLWPGTSITAQATTTRINQLLRVGNASTSRFLSVEPQYESLDLTHWLPRIDWLIQGGESGHAPCPFDIEWAVELISQCKTCRVPYFLKQLGSAVVRNGKRVHFADHHGGDWSEWPKKIRVRQMPDGKQPASASSPQEDHSEEKQRRSEIAKRAWKTRRDNERKRKL